MRALLIVNPQATSTASSCLDAIVRRLAATVELDSAETRYRGHAGELAADAIAGNRQVIVVLGGDGTMNEVVNGVLRGAAGRTASRNHSAVGVDDRAYGAEPAAGDPAHVHAGVAHRVPMLAPLPGGSANVFARSLGLPAHPVAAVEQVIRCLVAGRSRTIGLGMAADRYFTFSAGLGLDAEVVRAVEDLRAHGRRASPSLYLRATLRQYFRATDRRIPALVLERGGHPAIDGLFMGVVSNTTPWTYLGSHPLSPTPLADFNTGLDVFALRQLRTLSTLNALRQMMQHRNRPLTGRHVVTLHDEAELTLRARRPIAFQVDGEYVGEPTAVTFRYLSEALRVVA